MNSATPTKDATVVDLGCGTCDLTAELHKTVKAKKTWGLDSSDQMLEKALTFETATLNFLKSDISAMSCLNLR
ncbi:MAG: class I SAM-dependent methyltransferase [Bdellovibrio sp.]|nr:class I SAM-dependent methyltransferase [Bdellovibrio sp.]